MKTIKGNKRLSDEVLKKTTVIAKKYFKHLKCTVGIFQSTKDFLTNGSSTLIPAITVAKDDSNVTLSAHPFLEGIRESFKVTGVDYLICISDKGKKRDNLDAVLGHELKHVEQKYFHRKIFAQSQCLAIKLKNSQPPPHKLDAKLFEEKYFDEPAVISLDYNWKSETKLNFKPLKSDFKGLLSLFLKIQKSRDLPPIYTVQPKETNIPLVGDYFSKEDIDFYIHFLKIALDHDKK